MPSEDMHGYNSSGVDLMNGQQHTNWIISQTKSNELFYYYIHVHVTQTESKHMIYTIDW